MRTTTDKAPTGTEDDQGDAGRDLELLLHGDEAEDREGPVINRQGADLQELVLRIRLQPGGALGKSRQVNEQV